MPRIVTTLTDTKIKKAKPEDKALSAGKGLYLVIEKTGAKIWRFKYTKPYSKNRTNITLGRYPEISLQQAHEIRAEYLALLAQNQPLNLRCWKIGSLGSLF